MLPIIEKLITRPIGHTITFEYHDCYGTILVTCWVKPIYHKSLATRAIAKTDEEALDRALKLLEKVKQLETDIAAAEGKEEWAVHLEPKNPEKQKNDGGYLREFHLNDIEVEFRRHYDKFDISGITRKDQYGFYITETPYPPGENLKKVTNNAEIETRFACKLSPLNEGEEWWVWDDIRPLSGSAGLLVVKDGLVIREKCYIIS